MSESRNTKLGRYLAEYEKVTKAVLWYKLGRIPSEADIWPEAIEALLKNLGICFSAISRVIKRRAISDLRPR